jgi:hypothetical protein
MRSSVTARIQIARCAGFAAGLFLACALPAAAQTRGSVFGGATLGDDREAYLGVSAPLPGGRVGAGPALRLIGGASEYRYNAAVGRVRGRETRADLSLLWQVSDARNYFDAGVGGRYVHTRLRPADPASNRAGGRWEPVISASGQHALDPWAMSEFASYGFRDHDYFVRGDVTYKIAPAWGLGVEAQADGARDYSRWRGGLVAALGLASGWRVKLSGGITDQDGHTGGYGGLSFQAGF